MLILRYDEEFNMTYLVLLSIGIILVIVSLIYIKKEERENNSRYANIEKMYLEIKSYSDISVKVMEEYEKLVDLSMDKIESTLEIKDENKNYNLKEKRNFFKRENKLEEDEDVDVEKVLELKDIGLNNKEIARKLNKGIREVDIILKMNKKNMKREKIYVE